MSNLFSNYKKRLLNKSLGQIVEVEANKNFELFQDSIQYTQIVPSNEWKIYHGFDTNDIMIEVFIQNNANLDKSEPRIEFVDTNNIILHFSNVLVTGICNIFYFGNDYEIITQLIIPTLTPTPTPSPTLSPTPSVTSSVTPSPTVQLSVTPTQTLSKTPPNTPSVTPSITGSNTPLPSVTPTISVTLSPSPTISVTPSVTPTSTVTPSITMSQTASVTPTSSATPTVTPTSGVTSTPTLTPTPSASLTPSVTVSITMTPSLTATPSITPTITITPSTSLTPTLSPSLSSTITPSVSPTISFTPTGTPAPGSSVTPTVTPTVTPSVTVTPSMTLTPSFTPTPSLTTSFSPIVNAVQIAAGELHAVEIRPNKTVVAWGNNAHGQTNVPAGLANVKSVSAGGEQSLALLENGTLIGWGADTTSSNAPAGNNYNYIASGSINNFAIDNSFNITGWNSTSGAIISGDFQNYNGICYQLKAQGSVIYLLTDGTVKVSPYPIDTNNDPYSLIPNTPTTNNIIGIDTTIPNCAVVMSNGTAYVWGDNTYGQTNVPAGIFDAKQIALGGSSNTTNNEHLKCHAVLLKSDGTVLAWGNNDFGQTNVPAGLTNVQAIDAGYGFTLAVKSDGTIVAWGDNSNGIIDVPT